MSSLTFPSEIAVVRGKGFRPDGVIWSSSSKTVIWIELTSPWEENMSKRHYEKKTRYNKLALELRKPQCAGGAWTVHPLEVEIGARGTINPQSWQRMCKIMGFETNIRDRLTCSTGCCSALQPHIPLPFSQNWATLLLHNTLLIRSLAMLEGNPEPGDDRRQH